MNAGIDKTVCRFQDIYVIGERYHVKLNFTPFSVLYWKPMKTSASVASAKVRLGTVFRFLTQARSKYLSIDS